MNPIAILVRDFLENSADRLPDKTALVCDGRRFTYAQIDEMANRLANAMLQRGVGRGDRVAIYLNNSVEAVVGIFAALKAGAVFVPVNPTTKRDKLAYILNNCRACGLLIDGRRQSMLGELLLEVPWLKFAVLCRGSVIEVSMGT
jgi:long-chain acyl-CoA synthetase